jgi:hypothetical protein
MKEEVHGNPEDHTEGWTVRMFGTNNLKKEAV